MSHEYAMSRVKDALEKSGGNHQKTHRLILSWLEKDHSLLFGLVGPHLQSIVTHAIARATQPPRKEMPKKINIRDAETGEFGNALLSSLTEKSGSYGEAAPRTAQKPSKASKEHIAAINLLANASKNKDKKTKK